MTAFDHAADADDIADRMFGDRFANARDTTDDFMAGHAGINGVRPFVLRLMDVRNGTRRSG